MEVKDGGVCRFCLKTFSGPPMGRHLVACNAKKEADNKALEAKKAQHAIYHIKISGYKLYWLHVEIKATAALSLLDNFLRNIWLECCWHLSEFKINGVHYSSHPMEDSWFGMEQMSMDVPLNRVMGVKDGFEYQYDFGSTTRLEGKVVAERRGVLNKPVRILARNNPLEFQCSQCDKKATQICMDYSRLFCNGCLSKHGVDPDRTIPVVNSPRMGVCGYCGESDSDTFAIK